MASKYAQKKAKQQISTAQVFINGCPSSQPFMKGKCASGQNMIQHRKATKKLSARIKDFANIDFRRHKGGCNSGGWHCPGSMQVC